MQQGNNKISKLKELSPSKKYYCSTTQKDRIHRLTHMDAKKVSAIWGYNVKDYTTKPKETYVSYNEGYNNNYVSNEPNNNSNKNKKNIVDKIEGRVIFKMEKDLRPFEVSQDICNALRIGAKKARTPEPSYTR